MGTDWTTDWAQLHKWAADDRVQAQAQPDIIRKPDYAAFWATTARAAAFGASGHTSEAEALREEIQAQAEVIEAQDMQIEALQEERAELLAELDRIPDHPVKIPTV
jgi:hypothetical protein